MGSQQKKKKRTKDVRSTTSEIKRTQDLDANKLALQPRFDIGYSPLGVGTIDIVNLSETINASQTGIVAPAQITGLNVTVGGDNELDLVWTASATPGVYYNIYRSTSSGAETFINTSTTNSFIDVTVNSSTTYFYKVAAVNDIGVVGTLSVEDSATTTGPPAGTAPPPTFSLALSGGAPSTQVNVSYGSVSFSPAVTSFKVYYANNPGFSPGFVVSGVPGPGPGSTGVPGLTPNTTYYFKMSSVNSNGEGSASAVQNITTAP